MKSLMTPSPRAAVSLRGGPGPFPVHLAHALAIQPVKSWRSVHLVQNSVRSCLKNKRGSNGTEHRQGTRGALALRWRSAGCPLGIPAGQPLHSLLMASVLLFASVHFYCGAAGQACVRPTASGVRSPSVEPSPGNPQHSQVCSSCFIC